MTTPNNAVPHRVCRRPDSTQGRSANSAGAAAAALLGAAGMDVAQAGTYPRGGSYHSGGAGATATPGPDPTSLTSVAYTPQLKAQPPCGAAVYTDCS
jgi:hypothetical protein